MYIDADTNQDMILSLRRQDQFRQDTTDFFPIQHNVIRPFDPRRQICQIADCFLYSHPHQQREHGYPVCSASLLSRRVIQMPQPAGEENPFPRGLSQPSVFRLRQAGHDLPPFCSRRRASSLVESTSSRKQDVLPAQTVFKYRSSSSLEKTSSVFGMFLLLSFNFRIPQCSQHHRFNGMHTVFRFIKYNGFL